MWDNTGSEQKEGLSPFGCNKKQQEFQPKSGDKSEKDKRKTAWNAYGRAGAHWAPLRRFRKASGMLRPGVGAAIGRQSKAILRVCGKTGQVG